MGPELTRPNRGLQMWLPLHVHGVSAFRAELDRMFDHADVTADALSKLSGITIATAGPHSSANAPAPLSHSV
jgi:aromatic-L-amino-acid decarboxylase